MQDIQTELIEKYQLLLEKDPRSQVFAPLSEAYRKMEMHDEALKIASRGVKYNPNFAGGRIALARLLLDKKCHAQAISELEKAIELSPENLLAHILAGDCYLELKRPKDALRAFKMVLFLSPDNDKALRAVRKLESLTADEFDEELFQMKRLPELKSEDTVRLHPLEQGHMGSEKIQSLDRYLSMIDAYIVRNDIEHAWELVKEAEKHHLGSSELKKRLRLIESRSEDSQSETEGMRSEISAPKLPSRKQLAMEAKIRLLEKLLTRVRTYSQFTD